MSSPQEKLLAELRKSRANREDYKGLLDLPKGLKFPIHEYTTAKCKPFETEGKIMYCLVAHYSIGNLKFFTYMPADYQHEDENKVKSMAETFNEGLKEGKNSCPLWLCYYGKRGSRHVVDFLEKHEPVNESSLADCLNQAGDEVSPPKKLRTQ